MKREAVLAAIIEIGIVPVVRTESEEGAIRAIEAVYRGGIRAAEITMTVPGSQASASRMSKRSAQSAPVSRMSPVTWTTPSKYPANWPP